MSISQKAIRKYKESNYDRLELAVPKGARDTIKALAAAAGVSVNRYVLESIEARAGVPLALGEGLPAIVAAREKRAEQNSEKRSSATEQPNAEQRDAEQPNAEQRDAEQRDAEQPNAEQRDAEQPNAEQRDAEQPNAEQRKTIQRNRTAGRRTAGTK